MPSATYVALGSPIPGLFEIGGDTSGGGATVVCRNQGNAIVSAEMLEFYEARIRSQITIPESSGSLDNQLAEVVRRLSFDVALQRDFVSALTYIRSNMNFLSGGVSIAPGNDLGSEYAVVVPIGCSLELVGYYEKSGSLVVSSDVYNALSLTNQTAFLVHEALYKLERTINSADNSGNVRRTTAQLFNPMSTVQELELLTRPATWHTPYADRFISDNAGGRGEKFRLEVKRNGAPFEYSYSLGCVVRPWGQFLYGWSMPTQNSPDGSLELEDLNCPMVLLRVSVSDMGCLGSVEYKLSYNGFDVHSGVLAAEQRPGGCAYSSDQSKNIAIY